LQPKIATPAQAGNLPHARPIHSPQLHKTVRPPGNLGVVQRITFNAVNVNIGTLNLGDSRTHLGRLRRLRGQQAAQPPVAPALADVGYVYAQGDEDTLRAHIVTLEAQALENRRLAVVADLTQQLGALATVNDHTVQPPWAVNTPAGASNEVVGQGTLAPNVVVARWQTFLQAGAYSHKHPRTGVVDDTRLVAADGQRSIRYGDHERNSTANLHHFHEETWTHDANANTVGVANVVRRVPVT
jgi:hypothetical protein